MFQNASWSTSPNVSNTKIAQCSTVGDLHKWCYSTTYLITAIGCKHVDSDVSLHWLYTLKPQNAELSVTTRDTVSFITLIPYSRGYLYWSDVLTDTIYRANMTHTSNRVVLVNTSTDLVGMYMHKLDCNMHMYDVLIMNCHV